jgi:hypothetical protein
MSDVSEMHLNRTPKELNIDITWTFNDPVTDEDLQTAGRFIQESILRALEPWYVKLWRKIKQTLSRWYHRIFK